MELDKSPGIDGLTPNFYKHFWPLFGTRLTHVYNYTLRTGRLSVSQRRGVISLLFKKGDRTVLKNWRPITLLTTDYKILTKALANRLQQVLPLIVHTDQTASIKGRTINDNTRLSHDVITYANVTTFHSCSQTWINWRLLIASRMIFLLKHCSALGLARTLCDGFRLSTIPYQAQ